MPRRRIGNLSASTHRSFLLTSRRSPSLLRYTQVRSSTAVTRTLTPFNCASNPSMRISSSSRSTSLRRRIPPGRGRGGSSIVARAAGERLMVRRADAGGPVGGLRVLGGGAPRRDRAGFFAGRLEELTPELPDLADRVRHARHD